MTQYRAIDADEADEFRYRVTQEGSRYERVAIVDHGSGRWESYHDLVLMDTWDDTFWSASYSEGLTESQDSSGFEVTGANDKPVVVFKRMNQERVYTYIYTEYEEDE